MGEWRTVEGRVNDEGSLSGGVVNEICESVWSAEKNGVTYPSPHLNWCGVGSNGGIGGIFPLRQTDAGKDDWVGPR